MSHLTSAPPLFPSLLSFHLRGQINYSQCGEWIFTSCFNFNFPFIICVFHLKYHNPIHFPPLCIYPLPWQQPPNKIKFKRKKKKNQSYHESCSVTQWVTQAVDRSFVHTSLLAIVHYKELLVWFKVSGFCCTLNAGPSLELLLVISMFPCVVEILLLWVYRTGTISCSSRSQMGQGALSTPPTRACTLIFKVGDVYAYCCLCITSKIDWPSIMISYSFLFWSKPW